MHERTDAHCAAGANRGRAGLVRAVFLRIALDDALLIEHAFVPDDSQGRLGDEDAVVEYALAETNTDQTPEHAFEGRAVENVHEVDGVQLPHSLDPPKTAVVDRTDARRRRSQRFEAALHQRVIDGGDDRAEREEQRHERVGEYIVEELEGGDVDEDQEEDTKPSRGKEDAYRLKVEPVLGGETAAHGLSGPKMV